MPGLRTILVPFNNTQPNAAAVDAAKRVAETEGAYIEGAYSRQVLPIIAGEGITLPGDYLAAFEEEGRQQATLAREAFESLIAERGIPCIPENTCAEEELEFFLSALYPT